MLQKNTGQMHPITHLIIIPMPERNCNLNATNKTSVVSIATSKGKHIEKWSGSCEVKDRESACVKSDHRRVRQREKKRRQSLCILFETVDGHSPARRISDPTRYSHLRRREKYMSEMNGHFQILLLPEGLEDMDACFHLWVIIKGWLWDMNKEIKSHWKI